MKEYIERDRLYELGYWHCATPTLDNPFPDGVDAVDTKDIDSIPAADVRPVVRGKWRLGGYGQISDATEKWYDKYLQGGFLYCSVCKGRSSVKFNFCPKCGADMREES